MKIKNIYLISSLLCLFLFYSFDFANHSHDGRYFGKLQMLGINIMDVDVLIEGNIFYVRNSLANIDTKLKCKQFKNKIEVTNDNNTVIIFHILPNGNLKINDINNSRTKGNSSDDEDSKEDNKIGLNNRTTSSTIGNKNSETIFLLMMKTEQSNAEFIKKKLGFIVKILLKIMKNLNNTEFINLQKEKM